jgi:hypothetical protein
MAQIKTSNFLPEVFRTDTNQKFLNATLDQLVTQPDLRNVNGYIGRKFAPTFKSTDNYVPEPTALRQNYQLEPGVVVKNKTTGKNDFYSSYIDLINQINYYGGITDDHSRLFANESYSFDGLFDFDKFVNFTQYYWLGDGPDPVLVYGAEVPTTETFTVTRSPGTGSYIFSNQNGIENPTLRLAYGGTYTFIVNQPGYPFWIQSSPGVSGLKSNQTNLSSRDVLGVTNNGIDVGTITFTVPQPSAQDNYIQLPLAGTVDLSTTLHYTDIQGEPLSAIVSKFENGIDGVSAPNQLNLKSLIFVNNDLEDSLWTAEGIFDEYNFDYTNYDGVAPYISQIVPVAIRRNAWQITLSNDPDPIVTLNPLAQAFTITTGQKVFVKSGASRAEYSYYLETDYLNYNVFKTVPNITAPSPVVYYQDGIVASFSGQIELLVVTDSAVKVDQDIVGAKAYTSPNGVIFTNGLKVSFDSSVVPSSYANKTYYVEGVGNSIKLLDTTSFTTPEQYTGIGSPDYLTINRASIDSNPWTRSNRWFHIDIINATATYNGTVPLLDQSLRATRPIIEFESNLQLFNFGRVAKAPVDLIDFTITDARNTVELATAGYYIPAATVGGISYAATPVLTQGMRIVFANDFDPTVRNQIYVVNIVYIQALTANVINLVPADDYIISPNNNLVVAQGSNKGLEYWYNGANWIQGQQKNSINQAPLFDVIDSNGVSLSNYSNSTFAGTKIFSYTPNTVTGIVPDPILGFPLSYRNFNQIGDIQFTNNFDSDNFSYFDDSTQTTITGAINNIGLLHQNTSLVDYNVRNTWTTNTEKSKQFQIISNIYDGKNRYFKLDIFSNKASTTPYFKVFVNSIETTKYLILKPSGALVYLQMYSSSLAAGDQIDILIYSDSVSQLGYYEVPKNLDFNSANANFSTLTLGQLRNHLTTMVGNSNRVSGVVPGASNLRDVPIKAQGGNILQHASPVMYSELFLVDQNANFVKSLDLARHEYSKVKNKIIELSTRTPGLDFTNIPVLLDTLLSQINSVKNKTFAWYYSDMVPYGNIKNTITYTVLSTEIVDYEISNIFSDTTLSNTAVLVYKNNVQLVKGCDYVFDTTRSGITITAPLTIGDAITIYEYSNTDGNYIPETPTKLGLYPKFTPEIYLDTTYQTPINVIQGHDGSITPAWGDYRDQLLLEFEKRVYNNIKVNYEQNVFDIYNYLPGKFRSADYTNKEFTQLLTDSFLQWVGGNRVDYITNSYFVNNNAFTWNYNKFVDTVDGEALPGYWRGIFKYFYDTDRPHTNPWEMLGFTEQPTWWEKRYGPAPYTGGNLVLWGDLAAGYIWNDGNPYTDARFVRPDLLNLIPVDDTGALRAPNEFAVKSFNSNQASGNYKIGDCGPVETVWRRSSDYAFAMQQALALSHPAFYFGSLIDIGRYYKDSALNQYVLVDTLQRITPNAININGTSNGNTTYRSAGYINWIAEYLRNQGIDPGVKLYQYLNNVTVQLAYKMGGYTDKNFIEVIAEQSSPSSTNNGVVIPTESYSIELYKSTPTKTITYSAVVVEKTASGYTVSGFNFDEPYFTIIPSLANNNAYQIPVLNDVGVIYNDYQKYKVTVPYGFEFSNRQQIVDFLVSYQRYLRGIGIQLTDIDPDLGVQRDFLLSVKEFLTWAQQGWGENSVLVLSPILDKLTVYTATGVVDKVQNQPNQSRILDTNYNFIKYNQLSVTRDSIVNGNTFTVSANSGQTISLVKLDVVEYEHVIIFDNIDIFNDIIYVPELGNRQYRLKLVGKKTGSWTGAMNPPGFVFNSTNVDSWQQGTDYAMGSLVRYKNNNYTAIQDVAGDTTFNPNYWAQLTNAELKTGLLPNFSYNAEKFNRFNDVDNPETLGDFHLYSDSAIGFQPRGYLTNFGIDEVTQAKFYQGFIREKGTLNAINAFTAAGFNGISSNISLYEEWAMRVGEYGALNNNQYTEVVLSESTFNGDPFTFTLLSNTETTSNNVVGIYPANVYLASSEFQSNIYLNRSASSNYENDIQSAGYVNVDDIDTTIFSIGNYAQLSANIASVGIGTTIWCAKDTTNNWNVYRVTETNLTVKQVSYSIDNIGTVTTNQQHSFVYGDIVVIKGFDPRVDGFYQVYAVVDAFNFSIVFYGQNADQIKSAKKITGTGPVFHLQSSRINTPTDLNNITPPQGWANNDKLWIDNDAETNGWAVYNKSTPWSGNVSFLNPSMKLATNTSVSNAGFGTVTAINTAGTFAVAGMSFVGNGNVIAFVANVTNGNVFTEVANIGAYSASNNVSNFGTSLDTAGNLLYIGNPGNKSTDYGRVHIHKFDGNHSFPWSQTLTSPWGSNTGDAFGSSVSASADGTWLYVSAPNAGNVYVYHANTTSYYSYANTITVGSSAYAQFGYTIKTTSDGRQVAIGAPYQSVNGVNAAGAVYIYDRSVESFIANGNVYLTRYPINSSTLKVTLNGNVITSGFTTNANAVTFTTTPIIGSLITLDTNKIQQLEQLVSPTPMSGGAFGLTTYIAGNDADVYIASPGYSVPGYYSGIVYRFVNQGASYGTITSNANPIITPGDSMRINGFNVTFTSNTVANLAATINSAGIPGISATAQAYGAITITSNVTTPYQKLVLGPGPGNALGNLGLNTYANVQALMHPSSDQVTQFGSQVISSPNSSTLVVSATGGSTQNYTTFDSSTTVFDYSSTEYVDTIHGSGMVYVYGLVNGSFTTTTLDQYVFVQRLQNNNLSSNDQFGYSIAMNANTMLVGAPGDDHTVTFDPTSGLITPILNSGTYYTYNNFSGNVGWDIVRHQQPQVDIDSISRLYLYNSATKTLLTNLDYIDPAKGKVLGAAAEDLDYITAYDPAVYNAVGGVDSTPNLANSLDFHWGPNQVTQTWWNIDSVRYLNYEQGDVNYRANNWGRLFPGSRVQVCEWVESDMPPSAYTGLGTPLYPDNSAYVVESKINLVTNLVTSKYYFWVYDKNSLEINSTHKNTVKTIADLIENPQGQGIPYAAVVRSDSISLYGVSNYLSGNTTVLHADYDTLKNTNVIHSEYQLVQEGNGGSLIPARIINKMIDSLSGVDANGLPVPSTGLPLQASIGLGVNPNQTLFINRLTALENFVQYVNGILIQYPIVEEFILTPLYDVAPYPASTTYDLQVASHAELTYVDTNNLPIDYVVLVSNDETENGLWYTYTWTGSIWSATSYQSYNTPAYWNFVDWYDSSYDSTVLPTYVITTVSELASLTLNAGDTVKVLNNGNNQFVVYRKNADTTTSIVGIQNGTIQFSEILYTTSAAANEIRIIFEAIQNNIFIDSLESNFNQLFFVMINYILTEQPSVDWVFKTSFISIFHQLRKLNQPANYIPDNQTYYEQYINEVKPYRTSIREYKIDYTGDDEYYGDTTDFDIPATYIITEAGEFSNIYAYRSPNGSLSSDATNLSTLPQYNQWYNNHGYSISEVVVTNPGITSNILVTSLSLFANVTVSPGDVISQPISGASGTVYSATFADSVIHLSNITGTFAANTYTGNTYIYRNGSNLASNVSSTISNYVTTGYTSPPIVTVVGGGGTGANIIADINYTTNTISQFQVINPGYGYTSQPQILINGTGTGAAGYAKLENLYYIESLPTTTLNANANVHVYTGNIITQPNTGAYGTVYTTSTGNVITLINVNGTFASNQYIFSDLANLNTVATSTSSYTQFINQSYNTVRNITTTIAFDRTSYSSNVIAWQPNITVSANSVVSYNGQAYQATSNVYSTTILTLTGNVSASVGNYVTQANASGNAKITAISGNLVTVGNVTGSYNRRWGNILINGTDSSTQPLNINNVFDYTKYTPLAANTFTNAADRITSYYQPTAGMPGKDLSQLMSGISYPGVNVTGVKFNANTSVVNSNVVYAYSNIGSLYSSNVSLLDFTTLGYAIGQPLTLINNDSANTYKLTIAAISSNILIVSGATTTITNGANVTLKYYDYNNPTYLDTIIQNTYTNTGFGSNINDVTIDGGVYYDTYSSHAPEELIPGTTFDNLNITVSTKFKNNSVVSSYRIVHTMNTNPSTVYFSGNGYGSNILIAQTFFANGNVSGNIWANGVVSLNNSTYSNWPQYYVINPSKNTTLAQPLNIADTSIYVTNASALTAPSILQQLPGIVYINGEKIIFWTVDTVNNVLGQIRRAVDGTGAPQTHAVGSTVIDTNTSELIPSGSLNANVHLGTWLNQATASPQTFVDNFGTSIVDNYSNQITTNVSGSNAVTDGSGLENSTTSVAAFIKSFEQ